MKEGIFESKYPTLALFPEPFQKDKEMLARYLEVVNERIARGYTEDPTSERDYVKKERYSKQMKGKIGRGIMRDGWRRRMGKLKKKEE
jgi:hypothetical protein